MDSLFDQLKIDFRLHMNGVASQSMREKGSEWKYNWGVSLPELTRMAQQYEPDKAQAADLWSRHVRECKIIATMLMPPNELSIDEAEQWMNDITTQELAEIAAMHLFSRVPYAEQLVARWTTNAEPYHQICAYNIASRLLMKGQSQDETWLESLRDNATRALNSEHSGVRHAAYNCLNRL